jgi:hypothetical protein
VDENKQHLFQKSLSKLSTGIYTQLVDGVNKCFKAIPPAPCATDGVVVKSINQSVSGQEANQPEPQLVPSCFIEITDWQSIAEAEAIARQSMEAELIKWRSRTQTVIK